MGNPVMHWQILTKNPDALQRFYTTLFGWTVAAGNAIGYRQVATGAEAGIDGGLWPIAGGEGHSMVQLFVRVDDVKAHAVRAKELGATIVIPPQVLPGGDEMAVAVDPDGIPFAMFKGRGAFPS